MVAVSLQAKSNQKFSWFPFLRCRNKNGTNARKEKKCIGAKGAVTLGLKAFVRITFWCETLVLGNVELTLIQ
jgi:hypothetical protein